MAEISETKTNRRGKNHLHRVNRSIPRVDMTPMVDLGFLLITFFMLSVQMKTPGALDWDKRISGPQDPVSECCVPNILVDSADKVYTYEGENIKEMQPTSFDDGHGLRQVVMKKAKLVNTSCGNYSSGKPHQIICLIKLLPGSRFQNLTDIVDEMEITHAQYSIQDPLPDEVAQLKSKQAELLAEK